MATIKTLNDFQAWHKSRQVTLLVSNAVNVSAFQYNLKFKNQIINSALSVTANLAEGFGRQGNAEFLQFLSIAKASSVELRSHIQSATDMELLNNAQGKEIINLTNEVEAMIYTLMKWINASKFKGAKYK